MSCNHDYRCGKCGTAFEVRWASFDDFRRETECYACGGTAVQVWKQAPGLSGVEEPSTRGVTRTFRSGRDTQLGRTFDTRSERDAYLRARGLYALGPEEWKRTMNTTPRGQDKDPELPHLKEAMEKSWQELHAGKPAPEMGQFDAAAENVIMSGGDD